MSFIQTDCILKVSKYKYHTKCQKSEKITVLYIAHGFSQKMAPKSPPIFITFSDTY